MSLLLHAIAVAGGVLVGRWVGRGRTGKELPGDEEHEALAGRADGPAARAEADGNTLDVGKSSEPLLPAAPVEEVEEAVDFAPFPCALGDVVLRSLDGAEAWLAGGIVMREDAPAAILFVAPDATGERAILAWPKPRSELAWLSPVPPAALVVGAEPPSAIEIDGARFERTRRLPLRLQRIGTGAPDVGPVGVLGEYRSASGDVAVVLVADGVARGWKGKVLAEDEVEVWGGERATRAEGLRC